MEIIGKFKSESNKHHAHNGEEIIHPYIDNNILGSSCFGSCFHARTKSASRSNGCSQNNCNKGHTKHRNSYGGRIHFFIEKKIGQNKETKVKLRKHYEDDLKTVLKGWLEVRVIGSAYLGEKLHSPWVFLLLNVINEMSKLDKFKEVISHLQTGYAGEKIYVLYDQLENEEKGHNGKIVKYYDGLLGIHHAINTATSLRLFDREKRREVYYNFDYIIKFIVEVAEKKMNQTELKIAPYDGKYQVLTHRIIGEIAHGEEKDLEWLKSHLESSQVACLVEEFRRHRKSIQDINVTKYLFNEEIERLIHDADRSDLLGRCGFEDQLEKCHELKRK